MKKPKKPVKQPARPVSEPIEPVDALDSLESQLRTMLSVATNAFERTKGSDPSLLKQAVTLVTELRKVEAAKRKRSMELTLPVVVAYLRQLDPDDRARIGRELSAMSERGGVLG